ncbi:MAG: glycosyltransferase family 2 protein [Phycisphaerales bacterium]
MPIHPEASDEAIDLSVVAPAHNEEDNVRPLVEAVGGALADRGLDFEFILVDDASTDATAERAIDLQREFPWVRVVKLARPARGGGNGQSAAFKEGFARARGALIAVLDADLQNDPADLPAMLDLLQREHADMVQGDRSKARRQGDAWIRQVGSIVGRLFRRLLLNDTIRDTGCSLRVMKREIALRLPLEFKGAHRFIPVTARQMGYTVVEMDVSHHHRHAGQTKYGMGITKRAIPGLIDCFAIRWMGKRRRVPTGVSESASPTAKGGMDRADAVVVTRQREPEHSA